MAQSNQRFVTAENIMARLALEHKNKNFTINEIVQWCAECSLEVIGNPDALYNYNKVKLYVEDRKALLPCNVYRLLDVYNVKDNRLSNYYNNGTYLLFDTETTFDTDKNLPNKKVVLVNYIGIAIDTKTGYPLIPRGQELACMSYCVWKLYYEDYLTSRINGQQWQYIDNQKIIQCEAGRGGFRNYTNDDMKKMLNITLNMVPNIKNLPMIHLDGVEQQF